MQIVNNRTECAEKNYTWINSKISFDNVGTAYLALFQVVSVYFISDFLKQLYVTYV